MIQCGPITSLIGGLWGCTPACNIEKFRYIDLTGRCNTATPLKNTLFIGNGYKYSNILQVWAWKHTAHI